MKFSFRTKKNNFQCSKFILFFENFLNYDEIIKKINQNFKQIKIPIPKNFKKKADPFFDINIRNYFKH